MLLRVVGQQLALLAGLRRHAPVGGKPGHRQAARLWTCEAGRPPRPTPRASGRKPGGVWALGRPQAPRSPTVAAAVAASKGQEPDAARRRLRHRPLVAPPTRTSCRLRGNRNRMRSNAPNRRQQPTHLPHPSESRDFGSQRPPRARRPQNEGLPVACCKRDSEP